MEWLTYDIVPKIVTATLTTLGLVILTSWQSMRETKTIHRSSTALVLAHYRR